MQDSEEANVTAGLTRMAELFGREPLLPVVAGLQDELRRALDRPEMADAHRIAGLAGTLGFLTVSRAWQAVDQDDADRVEAASKSGAALAAIEVWLQEHG